MALTQQQQDDQADADLAKKIQLELQFSPALVALFRRMADDLEKSYNATGTVVDSSTYRSDFQAFFDELYNETSLQFQNPLSQQLDEEAPVIQQTLQASGELGPQNVQDVIDQMNAKAATALTPFIAQGVLDQTTNVTNTNQSNIDAALAFAVALQITRQLTRQQTANALKQKFLDLTGARTNTILATSVQNASEGTKNIVAQEYDRELQRITFKSTIEKSWQTREDDKVRSAHAEAQGQKQPFNTPFVVGGELLRYPGDTSLGASAENVIGCRCVMIPSFG